MFNIYYTRRDLSLTTSVSSGLLTIKIKIIGIKLSYTYFNKVTSSFK